VRSLILLPLFATGVNLPLVSLILVAMTPALPLAKFTTGVVDTSDAPCLANISENLKKF
jgi:hypothetical protein